jgi:hypothetical protein
LNRDELYPFDEGDVVKFKSTKDLLEHQKAWDDRIEKCGGMVNKQYYDAWSITKERAELWGDKVVTIISQGSNIASDPCYYFSSDELVDEGQWGRQITELFEEIPGDDKK